MPAEKKKLLILAILEILRNNTDSAHRLRQQQMIDFLASDYGLTATRKSVRQNLADLQMAGYPVVFLHGWYYEHEFSGAELNFVVDCVSGASLPLCQREKLIAKLTRMGGKYFRPSAETGHIRPVNPQFLATLELLHSAIDEGVQVSFRYGWWDADKELKPKLDETGKPKTYRINPYRVAMANGRYYLICNVDKYDTLCHFRIDRILDAHKLKRAVKPVRLLHEADDLELPSYTSGHAYMYTGATECFRLRLQRKAIGDALDWFGMDIRLEPIDEDTVEALVQSDPTSMELWLKRYGDQAELIVDP